MPIPRRHADFRCCRCRRRSSSMPRAGRGPRFAAWVTSAVLVIVLLVSTVSAPAAAVLLGAQAIVFAIGAVRGPRQSPYGQLFAHVVATRLGPVTEREPVAPLKFAQLV